MFTTESSDNQHALIVDFLEKHIPSLKGKLENAPDIQWIEDEKALGIEHIRDLKEWLQERPYANNWKIAVVLRADTLTGEAQNAALKLLEEPPSYAYVLLVTAKPFALQPTIRSRCTLMGVGQKTVLRETEALPTTMTDAFALTETFAKDREEATRWMEQVMVDQHQKLRSAPTQKSIATLQILQSGLHNLKRNVNVRLAVEDVVLRTVFL